MADELMGIGRWLLADNRLNLLKNVTMHSVIEVVGVRLQNAPFGTAMVSVIAALTATSIRSVASKMRRRNFLDRRGTEFSVQLCSDKSFLGRVEWTRFLRSAYGASA